MSRPSEHLSLSSSAGARRSGPRLSAGKNVSAPTITITPTSSAANSGVVTGNVPGDGGTRFLRPRLPAIASIGMIMKKRPISIATPIVDVVPVRVRGQAAERRAVVAGARRERVEDLRQAVRSRVAGCSTCRSSATPTEIAVKHQDRQRKDQDDEHRHLHVVGLDLLAEVLRRAADHQAGDEHRQDDEDEDAVHARRRRRRRSPRRA